jgi:hypothetical protein
MADNAPIPAKPLSGLIRLGIAVTMLWIMVGHICPAVIEAIPPFRRYADELDRRGIHGGALFYTNVEENAEAELQIRNTIRFLPRGPLPPEKNVAP